MIESETELQTLFNEFVQEAVEAGDGVIGLPGLVEWLRARGAAIEGPGAYDEPIGGLKSFYDLAADCPREIEEDGYDEFTIGD